MFDPLPQIGRTVTAAQVASGGKYIIPAVQQANGPEKRAGSQPQQPSVGAARLGVSRSTHPADALRGKGRPARHGCQPGPERVYTIEAGAHSGRGAPSLGPLLQWMVQHLDETFTVDDLARRATMSPRTFARRFVAETGTTPHQWLTDQRVLRARHLLEETDLSVEEVARDAGFGSAALLRHHFTKCTGISPTTFRTQHRVSA